MTKEVFDRIAAGLNEAIAYSRLTHGERRKLAILNEGVKHWPEVSARGIAKALGLSHGAVLYHFSGIDGLRAAIARHAVQTADSRVIVHLIAGSHSAVADMTDDARQSHMRAAR